LRMDDILACTSLGFYIERYTPNSFFETLHEVHSAKLSSLTFHAGYGWEVTVQQLEALLGQCPNLLKLTLYGLYLTNYPSTLTHLTIREHLYSAECDQYRETFLESRAGWAAITALSNLLELEID
jgi:hypothetical protein